MKKIYIIALLFHSGLVLAHSPINNDFESMIKHMFQFGNQFGLGPKGGHFGGPQGQFADNQMKMMDMHHKHLFKRTGKKNNHKRWRSATQISDENSIKLNITLKGMDKENLDIHINKNILVIRAEKEISGESSHTKYSFMRQFLIPKNTDRSAITAEFEDGVLVVTIPKPTKDKPDIQQITIQ